MKQPAALWNMTAAHCTIALMMAVCCADAVQQTRFSIRRVQPTLAEPDADRPGYTGYKSLASDRPGLSTLPGPGANRPGYFSYKSLASDRPGLSTLPGPGAN